MDDLTASRVHFGTDGIFKTGLTTIHANILETDGLLSVVVEMDCMPSRSSVLKPDGSFRVHHNIC
jgi:hypothetical protein